MGKASTGGRGSARAKAPRRAEPRSEDIAARMDRLDDSGFFQLEPTEPTSRGAQRYAAEKLRKHVRRVRSPRFSDDEFRRLKRQAERLDSEELSLRFSSKPMAPLEFIRVASMAVVHALEEMQGPEARKIWELLRALPSSAARGASPAGARNAPDRRSSRTAASTSALEAPPLTLRDAAFRKGEEGVCYVCGRAARGWGLSFDTIGRAHNKCLLELSLSLVKKRDLLLATLQKQGARGAMPSREEVLSLRHAGLPDCAKCNDAGSYEDGDDTFTCTCKHGLGDEPENPACALCDDGKDAGSECHCKRGALAAELEPTTQKAVAS